MTDLIKNQEQDLYYRQWLANDPKCIFLLVHGIGAYSERWEIPAQYFLTKQISSYAIELKGFGETPGLAGHIESFQIYYADILKLKELIQKENPGKKIFLFGDSMGSLVAFNYAAQHPQDFPGVILGSPAFKNAMKFSFWSYLALGFFLVVNPKFRIKLPFKGEEITKDKTYKEKMDKDNKEIRVASVKLLFNILLEQLTARNNAYNFKMPVLMLLAGNDLLVDTKIAKGVFADLPITDKQLIEYPGMLHALTIDKEREKVFNDILNWLQRRV